MSPEVHPDALSLQRGRSGLLLRTVATLEQQHRVALGAQQTGHTKAGAPQADNSNRRACNQLLENEHRNRAFGLAQAGFIE